MLILGQHFKVTIINEDLRNRFTADKSDFTIITLFDGATE